jgi:uncharacterized protein YcbX
MNVLQLWRYPVKSMVGEKLTETELRDSGVAHDRGWAVRDETTGKTGTAKLWPKLITCRAELKSGKPVITFPDGRSMPAGDPGTAEALSQHLGRKVTLHPVDGGAPTFPSDALESSPPLSTYLDAWPILLLTTASLAALEKLAPGPNYDVRRFRPNILVSCGRAGFEETNWKPGTRLKVGLAVLRMMGLRKRCVMTTLEQPDLPLDRRVLETIGRRLNNEFGADMTVEKPGFVKVGDTVELIG